MSDAPIGERLVPWVFEVVGPIVWLVMLVVLIVQRKRTGSFSLWALVFIACTSMWWQEWYGDWASYLIYNPDFALIEWGSSTWTTPYKPWAVIPAYGWYMAAVFPAMLAIVHRVRARRPDWGKLKSLLIVSVPIFYVWDLLVEGGAAFLGWWTYLDPIGPSLDFDRGSFPLLYPILPFVGFGVLATWVLDQRDDRGRWRHEILLGVHRVEAGFRRDVAQIGSWILTMNFLYWVPFILPIVLRREIWGGHNPAVP